MSFKLGGGKYNSVEDFIASGDIEHMQVTPVDSDIEEVNKYEYFWKLFEIALQSEDDCDQ